MAHDIGVWLFDQMVGTLSLVGGAAELSISPRLADATRCDGAVAVFAAESRAI